MLWHMDMRFVDWSMLCVHWGRRRKLITTGALFRAAGGGEFAASSTGGQISSRLLSMRSAKALLELPAVSVLIAFFLPAKGRPGNEGCRAASRSKPLARHVVSVPLAACFL